MEKCDACQFDRKSLNQFIIEFITNGLSSFGLIEEFIIQEEISENLDSRIFSHNGKQYNTSHELLKIFKDDINIASLDTYISLKNDFYSFNLSIHTT